MGAVTVGLGFTVIVKVTGVPLHPFADGVTVIVEVTGLVPVFVAVNTGIEWRESHDLTSVPVYGTVISYLHFNEDSGIYLEGGYGGAFGINKSKVWGDYQKYKLGVIIEDRFSIFLDYSIQDYPSQEFNNIQSISLGVSLINFW